MKRFSPQLSLIFIGCEENAGWGTADGGEGEAEISSALVQGHPGRSPSSPSQPSNSNSSYYNDNNACCCLHRD